MRFLTPAWALVLAAVSLHAEALDTLITASDLRKIVQPAAPVLSPDGKKIAYTLRTLEEQPGGEFAYRNHLWIASVDGETAPTALTAAGPNAYQPAWHPAGDRIAFVRPESDGRARVWIVPLAGGEPAPASPLLREAANPLWSPDGARLLFTATVTYDEVKAALEKAKAASTPSWSLEKPALPPAPPEPAAPTSTPASSIPKADAKPDAKKPAPAKPAKPAPPPPPPPAPSPDGNLPVRLSWLALNETQRNPIVINRLNLNASSNEGDEPRFTHLFVVERAGAEPADLTPGFRSFTRPAWSPDGQSIACTGPADDTTHPDRVHTTRLFILNTDGSDLRTLLASDDYSFNHSAWSPDGKQIAFTAQPCKDPADLSYGQTRLGVLSPAAPKLRLLSEKFDRSADAPRWSADGKSLYFTAETGGGVVLHRMPAGGGNPERITSPDTWVGGWTLGPDDLVFVLSRDGNPGELYRTRLSGRSARILTAHNSDWLRDKKTAAPERRKLKNPDRADIDYWVVKPTYLEGGFHYPLLVLVHGGPDSMWGPATPSIWHDIQFFAARGYGVLFVNPRGSSGYGAKFQRASFQNWGPGPSADVLAAVDAVSKENWVDRDRQVILGGSYGAYLTAWIIAHDQRFKAAIAARGVYDLTTFLGEADAWPLVPWHFGGYPWQPEIRKLLDEQSPLTHADAIRTPLLIKQNDADHQSGLAQGELLYRSLKLLNRPVELVRYPGANHNLSRTGDPRQRIDRLVRFDAFFQRFIGTPAQPIPLPPVTPPAPLATPSPASKPEAKPGPKPTPPAVPAPSSPATPPTPKNKEAPSPTAPPTDSMMDSMMMSPGSNMMSEK